MHEYKLMRRQEVERLVGLSRSTIYQMMAAGSFPRPVKVGQRAVRWRFNDLIQWISDKEKE